MSGSDLRRESDLECPLNMHGMGHYDNERKFRKLLKPEEMVVNEGYVDHPEGWLRLVEHRWFRAFAPERIMPADLPNEAVDVKTPAYRAQAPGSSTIWK